MPNISHWKKVTVPVTLHLTEEAARILYDYAGDRNRGKFISALLVAQRRSDDLEAERIRNRVVTELHNPSPPEKKKKAHR